MQQSMFVQQTGVHGERKYTQHSSRRQNHRSASIMPMISHREDPSPCPSEEILQNASVLIIVANSQAAITYVSPSVKTILGEVSIPRSVCGKY